MEVEEAKLRVLSEELSSLRVEWTVLQEIDGLEGQFKFSTRAVFPWNLGDNDMLRLKRALDSHRLDPGLYSSLT